MEGEDLLAKFDALTKRFKAEFEEIVEAERAKMKAEVDAYNAEKERMKSITVSDNDIIHLNVGGQKMTTKRSTLCQVEGSLLASMFSGRWEESLERDKDGCIFFDFNPQYFVLILDYLRAKKIETPSNPAMLANVAPEQVKNFHGLVAYLGLDEELTVTPKPAADSFKLHSSHITIQENGAVAVNGPSSSHRYVLGEKIYQEGIVHWKLRLESFLNDNWMFVGIVKGDTSRSDNDSFGWPGSYGWALGGSGPVLSDGKCSFNNSLKNLSKKGDTVEVVLDCTAAKLSLVLPGGQNFHLTLPGSATWKLHVNLFGANDKIRIVETF